MKKMEALHIAKMYMEEGYQTYEEDEHDIIQDLLDNDYEIKDINKIIKAFEELWDHAVYGF